MNPHTCTPKNPQVLMSETQVRDRVAAYLQTCRKSIITSEDILWSFPEMISEPTNGRNRWKWCAVKRSITFTLQEVYSQEWQQDSPNKIGVPKRWRRIEKEAQAVTA